MTPARLNSSIAWLFMVGSACFVLGSLTPYVNAVGARVDSVTYVVGSVFFTAASLCQLLQSQSPAMTDVDAATARVRAPIKLWAWLPHDRNWLAAVSQFPGTILFNISTSAALAHNLSTAEQDQNVWRPDFFGSTLFLVASAFAILALGGHIFRIQPRSFPWWIAWINMLGSILFMASAIASFVLPKSGELIDVPLAVSGTLYGAVCFLVGAALMLPAWNKALAPAPQSDSV